MPDPDTFQSGLISASVTATPVLLSSPASPLPAVPPPTIRTDREVLIDISFLAWDVPSGGGAAGGKSTVGAAQGPSRPAPPAGEHGPGRCRRRVPGQRPGSGAAVT